jgi:hypothetical protein
MGQAIWHASDSRVAAHELRQRLLRYRARNGVSRAREADEQHVVVAQPAAAALRVGAQPGLERGEGRFGDRDLALDVALAANEQVMVVLLARGRRIARAVRDRSSALRSPQSPRRRSSA